MHDDTFALCRDYLYEGFGRPDIVVVTDQAAIDFERAQDKTGAWGDGYYETLAVYRAIAERIPCTGAVLMHGAAVAIEDRAWLFMAPSGTGKSTHARWWCTEFADEKPFMVNGDKPIVRLYEDGVYVYGTPWAGKERLSTNVRVPLTAIGLLERSDEDFVEPIEAKAAFVELLTHTYRPVSADGARGTLETLQRISERVSLYRLGVTNSAHAAHVARAGMSAQHLC